VIGLGLIRQRAVLDLDEIADMHLVAQHRAGAQPRIRADHAVFADGGVLDMAKRRDARATTDAAIFQHAVGGDADVIGQFDAAFEHAIHVDADIAAAMQFAANVDACRIGQGDAGGEQRIGEIALLDAFQRGELRLAIDAFGFPAGGGMRGNHRPAFGHGEGDDVGQIVFVLRVVPAKRR